MSRRDELERLTDALWCGRMSRREFVERAAVVGLSVSTIGSVLMACGSNGEPEAARDGQQARGVAPAGAELGPVEKELHIYNWSDYIAEDTIPNFEKEFGVRVTYNTYESNEEMVAKLQAGATGYDIVVPSGYIVPVLVATNLAAPINKRYLTNWSNLAPLFLNLPFDPANTYTVPWQWGTTGIAYRKDKLTPPESWAIFLDARYKGKMTQIDDGRDVIGSWLRYRGHSLNSTDPKELAGAKADAIAAKRNLKAYISGPVKGQLISGDVWVAQLWSGDTTQAKTEQPTIEYLLPEEGCTIWADSLLIPRTAPHKRAAHEFMNYILRPEVGAAISTFTRYGTPNQAAMAKMENPVPYPTAEEMKRLEYQKDLGEATAVWDQIWTEIKSA